MVARCQSKTFCLNVACRADTTKIVKKVSQRGSRTNERSMRYAEDLDVSESDVTDFLFKLTTFRHCLFSISLIQYILLESIKFTTSCKMFLC